MEMRSLTRCLRLRPTTTSSLFYTRQFQAGLLSNQFLRFNSNSSSSPSDTRAPSEPSTSSETAAPSEQSPSKSSPFNFPKKSTSAPKEGSDTESSIEGILQEINFNKPTPSTPATSNPSKGDTGADAFASAGAKDLVNPVLKVNLQLGPTLGRSVHIEPGRIRLPDAIRILNSRLSQNNVRGDSFTQKHHVRKGLLKKNLRMRRWRKLFKYSFTHTLAKVERMRKQGW
ncbi:hypothetical protein BJX68DRAFT_197765 [Aspergillus pseudodeflectus]|uniref:Ribosomal protein S21 n=1 Tax=Aspergillus pseudodeflectus TaxID=176178 RepID=A0ABR4JHM4_9EURO